VTAPDRVADGHGLSAERVGDVLVGSLISPMPVEPPERPLF